MIPSHIFIPSSIGLLFASEKGLSLGLIVRPEPAQMLTVQSGQCISALQRLFSKFAIQFT